jgi:iron uptake system component EfeO
MSRLLTAVGTASLCAVLVGVAACSDDGAKVRVDETAAAGAGSGSLNEQGLGGPAKTKQLQAAVDSYRTYVLGQVAQLRTATTAFTDAVRAGDVARAKELYAPSRYAWEGIEPIAGLVPDIAAQVDKRVGSFAGPADPRFVGWHRLEYLLWVGRTTAGAAPFADRLDAALVSLQAGIPRIALTPRALVLGAAGLVREAAVSKIAGTEELYSHTDLSDLAANVEGAQAVLRTITPVLQAKNGTLFNSLLRGFGSVTASLSQYRGPGGVYRLYPALTDAGRQKITTQLTALAADWAKVAPALGV